ncbi:MAG TPA: hypothetical protein VFU06_12525 [Longimicrobiales bacterium]|nr:hypothetical protein [Longimicrobiales bacterium]
MLRAAHYLATAVSAAALCGSLVSGAVAQQTRSAVAPKPQSPTSGIDAALAELRAAMDLERRGDMAGADTALRAILDRDPQSLSAIIALERILAVEGRTEQLLPYVDRLIEEDPDSPIGNQMRVRAYSMLDRIDGIERAAESWIRATPDVETPYREVARIWQQRGDYERALAVLQQGRERVRRDDALALELGDLYAALGDAERAVREWERAIAEDGQGFLLVQRRLAQMPDGGAAVVRELIRSLLEPPGSHERVRAATQVAIDAGLADEGLRIARDAAAGMQPSERRSYLLDVARRADGSRLPTLAYWAYGELLALDAPEEQLLALRTRVAELALVVGDTARAVSEYASLEGALDTGSPQRRQSLAIRLELAARAGAVDEAVAQLDSFRTEFPDAMETDALLGAVGGALVQSGRLDDAQVLVGSARGPNASRVRGRVLLMRGDVERARTELMNAAPALSGADATETIALVTLLGRTSPVGGRLVGQALALLTEGERGAAVELLLSESRALNARERAALLDFAASTAQRAGLGALAEQARRAIIDELPRSQEAPAALLALARTLTRHPDGFAEAQLLAERLVLEHPRSALAPQARQLLDQLNARLSSSK